MWLIQWAKSSTKRNEFGLPIRNFAKVNDTLYRGALPGAEGYRALVERLGIGRVLSMTGTFRPHDRELALDSGIEEWFHVPFGDREMPPPERVLEWLEIVRTAPTRGAIYTHCMGGRHRTGVMVGVFRVTDCGWTKEQALQEMLRYGWYDALGHRPLLDWFMQVFDPHEFAPPDAPPIGSELSDISKSPA
jgi:hypothetical protein